MQFLSSVCIAAIATALFRILVPENKLQKQISLLIACVFLLTGISAVSGAELDFDLKETTVTDGRNYMSLSGEVNKDLQQRISKQMSDKLYSALNQREIYPEQIHVIVNISGLYSISISEVKLVLPESQQNRAEEAAELCEELSGVAVKTEIRQERTQSNGAEAERP